MGSVRTAVGIASTAILLWPGLHARAEPPELPSSGPAVLVSAASVTETVPQAAVTIKQEIAARGAIGGFGKPVDGGRLDEMRGGAELVVSDQRLRGTVANNVARDTVSGDNIVMGGSFANSTGLPTLIQNSGSNVLIQTGTIVNVQFHP